MKFYFSPEYKMLILVFTFRFSSNFQNIIISTFFNQFNNLNIHLKKNVKFSAKMKFYFSAEIKDFLKKLVFTYHCEY